MQENKKVIEFFKDTDSYINRNPVIELRRKIVHDLVGEPVGKRILDIGCGDGTLTIDYLKNNEITFLDFTPEMIDLVRTKISEEYLENVQFSNINILDLNKEIEYDIIICIGIYAHVSETLLLTKKIENLLKINGIAVIQFTNSVGFISGINRLKNIVLFRNKYKYSVNNHSTSEIEEIVTSCNLKILQRNSYWPVSPLFSLLKGDLKMRALLYFYNNKSLAKLGSEKVFLLGKI